MPRRSALACSWNLPIAVVAGDGCTLITKSGKRIIDFAGGWCVGTHGWGNEKIAEVVKQAAEKALYVPPTLSWEGWEDLASLLVKIAPGKLERAYRCCSGSEAVEFAVKCARAATGRDVIISVDGVYHGHTYGAASVGNAIERKMGPGVPHCEKIPMPTSKSKAKESLIILERYLKRGNVAAFLSEPVWSNAGVYVPPPEFYPSVQELCRKYGALLAMDEVAVGFGRCGALFACELWNLQPDILCLGKALTGGYGALGATLVTEEVFQKSQGIPDYVTFGWTPINCAAAIANVKLLLQHKLWENAAKVGRYLKDRLMKLQCHAEEPSPSVSSRVVPSTPVVVPRNVPRDEGLGVSKHLPPGGRHVPEGQGLVKEVRGIGLLIGITLHGQDFTEVQHACLNRGLYIEGWSAPDGSPYLFLSPPLVLDEETADRGVEILENILKLSP